MITAIRVFLRRLFGRNTDPQLDEEIATHIDMLTRDFELKGMTPEAARAAARRDFGPILQMLEVHRDTRRLPSLNSIAQDLGYALRQVRMNPGFVAAAVITLALGIGANTAIFDVLDRIVLRSLPVKDPDRLAALRLEQAFGVPLFRQMSARQTSVEGLFASGESGIRQASVDGRAIAEPVILYVTGDYFRLLGTQPQIGRLLADTDDAATAPAVIVVSDRFWRREFGGQSTALGQSIRLNDKVSAVIVGVTRPDFYGERLGQIPDAWIPMGLIAQLSPGLDSRSTSWLAPMARLRPDVPLDQAQRELETLLNQLMPDFGLVLRGVIQYRLQLVSAPQGLSNLHMEFSKPLWLLMGLVIFIVLIACCNLANLLLARGMARTHEIGIRLAIGASRGRIVRQLFVESLVIASAGGACGLAMAYWGSNALLALALAGQKQDLIAGFGWRVASFSILLSVVSACIFGLLPALLASRINLNSALQSATRTNVGSRSRHFATKAFGVAQLAISMLLVAGACLLVSSFWRLLHQDMGYSRSGILTFQPAFDASTFSFFRNPILPQTLNEQLNAVPGVQAAAYLQGGPLGAITETAAIALRDRPSEKSDGLRSIDVSARYFEAMGTRIISGRPIDESDRNGSPRVAVITETTARRIFGTTNPIGRLFTNGPEFKAGDTIEIVGVAHDIRFSNLREPFGGIVFLPITQVRAYTTPIFVIKTGTSPMRFVEPIREAVRGAAPNLRIEQFQPWDEIVGLTVRQERMVAWLSGAFGLLAIALASVGVYGVVAYGAERRVREIGIRLTLGARPRQLRVMLLREVFTLFLIGIALGGGATLILGKWARSLLFDLEPHDPVTLAFAIALLAVVVCLAAFLPARRASRLDPMTALRRE